MSTLPDERPLRNARWAQRVRRAGLTLLVAFVVAGAAGVFGTRSATTSGSAEGYDVVVHYPSWSRPGHAVRFEVEITHQGGFDGPVRVRLSSGYFDLFDENAFDPDPASSTATPDDDVYEFDPPPGDTLVISSDTRVEPARQRGTSGEVAVLDDAGADVLVVGFRTRLWP